MSNFKYIFTFWDKTENEMLGFVSQGRKYYNIYKGNVLTEKSTLEKIGTSSYQSEARKIIENYVRELKIPYTVRTSVNKYHNGNHLSLRFEHFDEKGDIVNKYYEAGYSLCRYSYYTTPKGNDVLLDTKD